MANYFWREVLPTAIACLTVILTSFTTDVLAATFNVPGDFSTIQAAIDDAASGDTILVGPQTYSERLDFSGKNIIVKSTDGPGVTIIDGGDLYDSDAVGVTFHGGEERGAVIEGFTITNCNKAVSFGVWASPSLPSSSPMVVGNRIVGNHYGIYGYVNYQEPAAEPLIAGNLIDANWCGIWLDHQANSYGGADAVIRNNTIVKNTTAGIKLRMHQSLPLINSNIITGNGYGIEFNYISAFEARRVRIWYNDLWGNTEDFYVGNDSADPQLVDLDGVQGNIAQDPQFDDAANSDYGLVGDSPCVDTGNPAADYNDSDGSRNDMGAFGGPTATADTTAPQTVTISSAWPQPETAAGDNTVKVIWSTPDDPGLSGLKGYSFVWDQNPDTDPDMVMDLRHAVTATTSSALPDGENHYFHVRAVDQAENWGATTHLGPFLIDSTISIPRRYQVTTIAPPVDFDGSRFDGINDLGEAVGECYDLDTASDEPTNHQALAWNPQDGLTLLATLHGESGAREVNTNGQIAGYAVDEQGHKRAVRWDGDGATILDLGTFYNPNAPAGAEYGDAGAAIGINDAGKITGYADINNDTDDFMPYHAFVYDDSDGLQDLGTLTTSFANYQNGYSVGYGINAADEIVGVANGLVGGGWVFRPFIYAPDQGIQALNIDPDYLLVETQATVINNSGLIGGLRIEGEDKFPYYWTDADVEEPIALALPEAYPSGQPMGINNDGVITGKMWDADGNPHAFIWEEVHGITDLNDVTQLPAGTVLTAARGINAVGQIVGSADVNGQPRAFILDPIQACRGDIDEDADVDASDLQVISADFNRSDCASATCPGDIDADDQVDETDLALMAANFGRSDCH
jgi:probable HAF family extracellular repeat protein